MSRQTSIRKSIFVPTLFVLWLCVPATVDAQRTTDASTSRLLGAFRKAHEQRNQDAMSKLFCWNGVTPELGSVTESHIVADFDEKIVSLRVTTEHPKQRPDVYIRNLPVVAELVEEYPPLTKGSLFEMFYPLGIRDGRYLIALLAPAREQQPQPIAPSQKPAGSQTQPSQSSAPNTPTLVPAGTVLVIRLEGDLGMNTIEAGGEFSAVLAKPVIVNGIAVIPAGAPAQVLVVKKAGFSPRSTGAIKRYPRRRTVSINVGSSAESEATLTSVTINGKAYKITTGNLIFNEEVVFPAGSQPTFELLFPLELNR